MQLREDLESLGFQQFHVVLYIRDPADFFLSVTQQRLKVTSTPPIVEDPLSFRYQFLRATETWEQAFPGMLIIRKYPTEPDNDVIDDFAAVLKQYLGVAPHRMPLRDNTTLSAESMQILQDYRRRFSPDQCELTPEASRIVRILSEPTPGLAQTKPVLKRVVAEQIRANHGADAEVIYSRYGVDLGFRNRTLAATFPIGDPHRDSEIRVGEILESVDPKVVQHLLMRLAQRKLDHGPAKQLALSAGGRAYPGIPPRYRPERLAMWLKSRLAGSKP